MFTCIVLSAGLSERFGSPKALAEFQGEKVIERVVKMLLESQLDEIIVVLGACADEIKPHLLKHKKVSLVYNKDYNFGQTSSFQAGLKAASIDSIGIMLLPVDYPLIQTATIDLLINQYGEQSAEILIPTFHQKKGHPPLFSSDLKNEFLALDHTVGLNTVAQRHQTGLIEVPVNDAGVRATFNTLEELNRLK